MGDRLMSHAHDRSKSAALSSAQSPNPASSILQEALRQEKTSRRLSRNLDSDLKQGAPGNGSNNRDFQRSPIPSPGNGRDVGHQRQSSGMGGRVSSATKGMGVREMEEHVAKLNKQNFDLKLELFHRRQRNDALEAEMDKLKDLENDNAELQSINEDLVQELELRDVAVKEAVALICELEAKIDGMELEQQHSSNHGLGSSTTPIPPVTSTSVGSPRIPKTPPPESVQDRLSPPRQSNKARSQKDEQPKTLGRAPSFLHEQKPSTSALRSLYEADGNLSNITLNRMGSPYRSNDPDSYTLNSPRLSMLSESSFLSVYGKSPKQFESSDSSELTPTGEGLLSCLSEDLPTSELKIPKQRSRSTAGFQQDRRGRVQRRVTDHNHEAQQTKRASSSASTSNQSFKSRLEHMSTVEHPNTSQSRHRETSRWLDESIVAEETSPTRQRQQRQKSSKLRRKPSSQASDNNFGSIGEVLQTTAKYKLDDIAKKPTLGGPIFSGPNVLPPTPDTMGTQKEANSSSQSIITEKSLRDHARFPAKNLSAMIPDGRPQTAISSLGLEFENGAENSDDERQSVHAQQSEAHTDAFIKESLQPSFPFMSGGSSSKAMQMMGASLSTRPPLTTYATNMMFDGDGVADIQPSRGMSYPSPTKSARCRSVAYTPPRPEHAISTSAQTQQSVTPTPSTARTSSRPSPLKPSLTHETSTPATPEQFQENPAPAAGDGKLPGIGKRFGFDKLKSRMSFGRSSSYAGDKELPSRIARPGTSGSGNIGQGGEVPRVQVGRSASLRLGVGRRVGEKG